jgi:hypothetical protein
MTTKRKSAPSGPIKLSERVRELSAEGTVAVHLQSRPSMWDHIIIDITDEVPSDRGGVMRLEDPGTYLHVAPDEIGYVAYEFSLGDIQSIVDENLLYNRLDWDVRSYAVFSPGALSKYARCTYHVEVDLLPPSETTAEVILI